MRKIRIDCQQQIPCNPCEESCPFGAIHIGEVITNRPQTDADKCTGCGVCVAACPGQACYLLDEEFAPGRASIDFPYEYLPKPVIGQKVMARDNEGQDICEGIVEKVIDTKKFDHTTVVRISVPKEFADQVRGMKRIVQ